MPAEDGASKHPASNAAQRSDDVRDGLSDPMYGVTRQIPALKVLGLSLWQSCWFSAERVGGKRGRAFYLGGTEPGFFWRIG